MKKSYLIYSLVVMMVMSLTMMSCKNNKKNRDYDDEMTEKTDRDKDIDDDIVIKEEVVSETGDSDAVSKFCQTADLISSNLTNASSEEELDAILERFDSLTDQYLNDTTPLSYADKQALSYSIGNMYGVVIGKMVIFDGGTADDLDSLGGAVELVGNRIEKAINATNSLSELEANLDKYVSGMFD